MKDRLPIHQRWAAKPEVFLVCHSARRREYLWRSGRIAPVFWLLVVGLWPRRSCLIQGQVNLNLWWSKWHWDTFFSHYFVFPLVTPLSLYPYSRNYHRSYSMLAIYSPSVWRNVIFYKFRYNVEVSGQTRALVVLISIPTGRERRWIQRRLWTRCRKQKYLTVVGNSNA